MLKVLHIAARSPGTESNGLIKIKKKAIYGLGITAKKGRTDWRNEGNRTEEVTDGALLEGGMDSATLEWLWRAVVVNHAAVRFTLSREEQGAEFGHL